VKRSLANPVCKKDLRNGDRLVRREALRQIARQRRRFCIAWGPANRCRRRRVASAAAGTEARPTTTIRTLTLVDRIARLGPHVDVLDGHVLARRAIRAEELDGCAADAISDVAIPVLSKRKPTVRYEFEVN
jgi:hypothetical protein